MGHALVTSALGGLCATFVVARAHGDATGLEIGARLGYGIPFGYVEAQKNTGDPDDDAHLDQVASGMVPFWLDLGARIRPELTIGGFLQLGMGFVGEGQEACDTQGVECSVVDVRIGVELQYHPLPFHQPDPWFGIGTGYEWLTRATRFDGTESSVTVHGFELANLQAGLDFHIGQGASIGPFASCSLGQYTRTSVKTDSSEYRTDISDKALHAWLVLGLRGSFVL